MRQKCRNKSSRIKKFAIILIPIMLIGVYGAAKAQAAIRYVDKDSPCPGNGASATPYCSIQNALNVASPGDSIRIRNGATPYDQYAVATRSGTATSPIILEPDTGHDPIIRYTGSGSRAAALEIRNADYWTIRNLRFDGSGVYTSRFGLWIHATTRNVFGNKVSGCTFRNWGGSETQAKDVAALIIHGEWGTIWYPTNTLVQNSVFDGNRETSLRILHTSGTTVDGNEIKNMFCGWETSIGAQIEVGIKEGQGSRYSMIKNNTIHDFKPFSACGLTSSGHANWNGYWGDTGTTNGQFLNNKIYRIDEAQSSTSSSKAGSIGVYGGLIESRCHGWVVKGNIVYRVGQGGFRNGSNSTNIANNTQYINNVVYKAGLTGLDLRGGSNLIIKNNILIENGKAQITFASLSYATGSGHIVNYNDHYKSSGGKTIAQAYSLYDFSGWKAATGFDKNSKNVNSLFVNVTSGSEDFHLQSTSPVRGAGEGGVDMGAYTSGGSSAIVISDAGTPTSLSVGQSSGSDNQVGKTVKPVVGAIFIPMSETSLSRTNLGINNLAVQAATVRVLRLDQAGIVIATLTVRVAPSGFKQINSISQALANQDRPGPGSLCVESDQPIRAWVSEVDHLTEDPSFWTGHERGSSRILIPSVANLSSFRSSLVLMNVGSTDAQVSLKAYDVEGSFLGQTQASVFLSPHGTLTFENVLESLGVKNNFGPLEIASVNQVPLLVTSRVSNALRTGGGFEGLTYDEARKFHVIPQVADTIERRTNLGINNPSDTVASVQLRLRAADGSELGSLATTIPPRGLAQLDHVVRQLTDSPGLSNLEGSIQLESDQPILAWAAQIDNLSQDPAFVPSQGQGVTQLLIPSVTNSGGFRSNLVVVNTGDGDALVDIVCRGPDGGIQAQLRKIFIPAKGYFNSPDILTHLGLSDRFGPLEITSLNGQPLVSTSRIYSTSRTSGFLEGQGY